MEQILLPRNKILHGGPPTPQFCSRAILHGMKDLPLASMFEAVMKWLGGMAPSIPVQLFLAGIQIGPPGVCLSVCCCSSVGTRCSVPRKQMAPDDEVCLYITKSNARPLCECQ